MEERGEIRGLRWGQGREEGDEGRRVFMLWDISRRYQSAEEEGVEEERDGNKEGGGACTKGTPTVPSRSFTPTGAYTLPPQPRSDHAAAARCQARASYFAFAAFSARTLQKESAALAGCAACRPRYSARTRARRRRQKLERLRTGKRVKKRRRENVSGGWYTRFLARVRRESGSSSDRKKLLTLL